MEPSFMAVSATGWVAFTAIATLLLVIVTAVSLRYIAEQVRLAREQADNASAAQVEDTIQKFSLEYIEFRKVLFILDVKRQMRDVVDWDDLGKLRVAAVQCLLYMPSVRSIINIGSDERVEQIREMYVSDVALVGSLLDYSSEDVKNKLEAAKVATDDHIFSACKAFGATDEEIERLKRLSSDANIKEFSDLYGALRTKYKLESGMTPTEIVEEDKKKNAQTKSDPVLIRKQYGLAHSEMALVGYWLAEFRDLSKRIAELSTKVATDFQKPANA